MHASSCAFTVVECIRTSKNCTFFTCPSFFCWSRRKGLHILFAFCIFFPWLNTAERNLPWTIPLAQLKITAINVATQLKPYFHEMLVLRNRISNRIWFLAFLRRGLSEKEKKQHFLVFLGGGGGNSGNANKVMLLVANNSENIEETHSGNL